MTTRFHGLFIPPRCHPLLRRVFEEMNRQKLPLSVVAKKSGVCTSTFAAWKRGDQSPTVQNLEAVCDVVGLRLRLE